MKTLLISLAVAIALAAGYWKTQHGDKSLTELGSFAGSKANQLKSNITDSDDTAVAQASERRAPADNSPELNRLSNAIATVSAENRDTAAAVVALEKKISELTARLDKQPVASASTGNENFVTQEELKSLRAGKQVEYKVLFDRNSTKINDAGQKELKKFIDKEEERTTGVAIYGFTDRRGAASYNQRLAMRRATKVRSFLIQNGFDFTKIISVNAIGEDAAATKLEDGADDPDQRSVILFAAQR